MESIHELLANDLVNASVPICWETHITAFHQGNRYLRGRGWDMFGGTVNQGEHISPLHRHCKRLFECIINLRAESNALIVILVACSWTE